MKTIMIIDSGLIDYTVGYAKALNKYYDVIIATSYNRGIPDIKTYNVFFKYSNKLKKGLIYKIIRTIEYIIAMIKISKYCIKNNINIVNIQFSLFAPIDIYIFRKIKKNSFLIYTCHDVIPHTNNVIKRFFNRWLYLIPDYILLHGEYLIRQMNIYYPDVKNYILMPHGFYVINGKQDLRINLNIDINKKIISFIGQIHPNKGLDRLINYWKNIEIQKDTMLIIAGRIFKKERGIEELINSIKNRSDVFIYIDYLPNNLHDYLYEITDVVVMPYKKTSMSGVLFSAVKHKATVLTTKAGAIPEYLKFVTEYCFICENNYNEFEKEMNKIIFKYSKKQLNQMGNMLFKEMYKLYSWDNIVYNLVNIIEDVKK